MVLLATPASDILRPEHPHNRICPPNVVNRALSECADRLYPYGVLNKAIFVGPDRQDQRVKRSVQLSRKDCHYYYPHVSHSFVSKCDLFTALRFGLVDCWRLKLWYFSRWVRQKRLLALLHQGFLVLVELLDAFQNAVPYIHKESTCQQV